MESCEHLTDGPRDDLFLLELRLAVSTDGIGLGTSALQTIQKLLEQLVEFCPGKLTSEGSEDVESLFESGSLVLFVVADSVSTTLELNFTAEDKELNDRHDDVFKFLDIEELFLNFKIKSLDALSSRLQFNAQYAMEEIFILILHDKREQGSNIIF